MRGYTAPIPLALGAVGEHSECATLSKVSKQGKHAFNRVWRHLIRGESAKASCDTAILCSGVFATIQRNDVIVAPFAEARNVTI